jgi:hypothetical protein
MSDKVEPPVSSRVVFVVTLAVVAAAAIAPTAVAIPGTQVHDGYLSGVGCGTTSTRTITVRPGDSTARVVKPHVGDVFSDDEDSYALQEPSFITLLAIDRDVRSGRVTFTAQQNGKGDLCDPVLAGEPQRWSTHLLDFVFAFRVSRNETVVCEAIDPVLNLRARGVSCDAASRLADRWGLRTRCQPATDPGGPRRVRCRLAGYTCSAVAPLTSQVIPVRCAAGARRVRFRYAIA